MTFLFIPMFKEFPRAQRDEENHWYDTDHVPQRLAAPGFLRAERWQRVAPRPSGERLTPLSYLHFYYIEGPEAVKNTAYAHQFRHVTPRSANKGFTPTPPAFRDVWSEFDRPWEEQMVLKPSEGETAMLVVAINGLDAPADALLTEALIPLMLSCPGLLRCRRLQRLNENVVNAPREHAPATLLLYSLSGAEAVTHPDYARHVELAARIASEARIPIKTCWAGTFARRPSPWTVRPVPRRT
jgi:hypothetical protein